MNLPQYVLVNGSQAPKPLTLEEQYMHCKELQMVSQVKPSYI